MSDFKDTPIEEDDGFDEIQMEEALLKTIVKFKHVKNYAIIDQSKTPREFGLYTEYRKFNQNITTHSFCSWDVPWEDQGVWKESEVCNLDGSPVFCGYFFTDFEEFSKNPKASLARLRSEKSRDQIDEIPVGESFLKSLLNFNHVKRYAIIDQSKTPREFGVYTEYRKFNQVTTTYGFCIREVSWEDQDDWKESELCNLDGSPVFCGYYFTNFEEFCENPEANFARLRMEKARDQMTSKL